MLLKIILGVLFFYWLFLGGFLLAFKRREARAKIKVAFVCDDEESGEDNIVVKISNASTERIEVKDGGVKIEDGKSFSFSAPYSFPCSLGANAALEISKGREDLRSMLSWEGYNGEVALYPYATDREGCEYVGKGVSFDMAVLNFRG